MSTAQTAGDNAVATPGQPAGTAQSTAVAWFDWCVCVCVCTPYHSLSINCCAASAMFISFRRQGDQKVEIATTMWYCSTSSGITWYVNLLRAHMFFTRLSLFPCRAATGSARLFSTLSNSSSGRRRKMASALRFITLSISRYGRRKGPRERRTVL